MLQSVVPTSFFIAQRGRALSPEIGGFIPATSFFLLTDRYRRCSVMLFQIISVIRFR